MNHTESQTALNKISRFFSEIAGYLIIAIIKLLRQLPRKWTLKIGLILGWLAYLFHIRKTIVLKNLVIAFPEMSESDRARLARKIYMNMGYFFGEWMSFNRWGEAIHKDVVVENIECLNKALTEGNGVLINSAHFGNWEVLVRVIRRYCPELTIVRTRLRPDSLDRLFTQLHAESDAETIIKGKSVKNIIACLKRGGAVGMLVDQSAGGSGLFLPFFGRLTSFHRGPALIARHSGAAFLTAYTIPGPDGRWRIIIRRIEAVSTGNAEEDSIRIMGAFARDLEAMIRAYPDRWFWFHRRWKTTPPGNFPHDP